MFAVCRGAYRAASRDAGRIGSDMNSINPNSTVAGGDVNGVKPAQGYAGDVSPQLAHQWLQAGNAVLVDVRTDAEREWVGQVPGAVALAWKQWPGMALNPSFDDGIKAAVPPGGRAVLLCRSGVRSIAAAKRATELGIEAYNILEGFEGDADEHGHRGRKGGWRFYGLPWTQN
jgi:rhodanese-related sulfurtransferase